VYYYRRPPWTLGAALLWLIALVVGGVLAWLDYRSHPHPEAMPHHDPAPRGDLIEFEIEEQ
jgi:hypothetical protein